MKKFLCAFLAVALLAFAAGCAQQQTDAPTEPAASVVTFYQAIGGLERLYIPRIDIENCETGEVRTTEDGGYIYNVYNQLKNQEFHITGDSQGEQQYRIELFDNAGGSVCYTFDQGFEAREGYTKTVLAGACVAADAEQIGYILSMFFNTLPPADLQLDSVE